MDKGLKQQCELFTSNRDILKHHFKWESSSIYPVCAALYTSENLEVNVPRIKNARELIKSETGIFSAFRGYVLTTLAVKLSLDDEPKEKLKRIKALYELFKSRFWGSAYIALAAISVEEQVDEEAYKETVEKTIAFYERMKQEHPLLTSREDVNFAVLYANSGIPEDEAVKRMERCYRILKGSFFSSNAVQSLSHAVAFSQEPEEIICERFMKLFKRLKENGCKYGTGIEIATLGLLAITLKDDEIEKAVKDILEVNQYLLSCHGFGAFGVGKVQRLMYSVLMTAMFYNSEEQRISETLLNSIIHLLLVRQAAAAGATAGAGA